MRNPASIKKILSIVFLIMGIILSSVAFAAPSQIVLFCSSWNMKCRDARMASSQSAHNLGLKYTELDIDDPSSQQKAQQLGVNPPKSIPYIYILDNKGKLVIEKLYRGEPPQVLEQQIRTAR